MTIVHILYSGLGGHFSVVFSLIEADKLKVYDYVVVFYGIEELPKSFLDKCEEIGIPYYFVKKKVGLDLGSQSKIIKILKDLNPDILILHTLNLILTAFLYAYWKKIRLISLEHQPNHLKEKKEWIWSILLMRLSTKVVFLTELYAIQMKKYLGVLYSSKKVRVINNGINTDFFKPMVTLSSEYQTIGMLARLSGTKDHITLVEAFRVLLDKDKKYHSLKLKIAGDGDMKEMIMQKVNELNLSQSVDFLGMVPEQLSPTFLNELTIYVHASFGETMSTAIMQAMACGKAIVASDVDGINNMITHGVTGLLVRVQDKEQMASTIGLLISDKTLKEKLQSAALETAKSKFSDQKMFLSYKNIF